MTIPYWVLLPAVTFYFYLIYHQIKRMNLDKEILAKFEKDDKLITRR